MKSQSLENTWLYHINSNSILAVQGAIWAGRPGVGGLVCCQFMVHQHSEDVWAKTCGHAWIYSYSVFIVGMCGPPVSFYGRMVLTMVIFHHVASCVEKITDRR
jgi:hypothetical protein